MPSRTVRWVTTAMAIGVVGCLAIPYLYEVVIGGGLVYAYFVPLPPAWIGVIVAMLLTLAGPGAAVRAWRRAEADGLRTVARLRKAEVHGMPLALPAAVIAIVWLVSATVI